MAAILAAGGEIAASSPLDDEMLSARAADVVDVADRVARQLAGRGVEGPLLASPAIVVAQDFAVVTATLPRGRMLGIALEAGSPTAHAAILARAYGIPAVVGVAGLVEALEAAGPDAELAIDGDSGEVVIDPDEAAIAAWTRGRPSSRRGRPTLPRPARRDAGWRGGHLLANIGTPEEAARSARWGHTASACSAPSSCSWSVHPAIGGRADGCLPRGRRGVRAAPGDDPAAGHGRRQADPVPAAASPRRTRSSVCGRCGSPPFGRRSS